MFRALELVFVPWGELLHRRNTSTAFCVLQYVESIFPSSGLDTRSVQNSLRRAKSVVLCLLLAS